MIHIVRVVFLLLVSAVALTYLARTVENSQASYFIMAGSVVVAFTIITVDVLIKKKNLTTLAGLFFGLLVGIIISIALGYIIDQVVSVFVDKSSAAPAQVLISEPYGPAVQQPGPATRRAAIGSRGAIIPYENNPALVDGTKLLVALMITYLTVSFILQTKDDFRFIIPYVEFQRATKGPRPLILDTSVIIDGRIADLATTGIFESRILLPRFVLVELQAVADSGDRLKRLKGRRGLDILQRLQAMPKLELRIWDGTLANAPEAEGVDQKLVALAQQEHGRLVTNDFNLNKVAQLRGVDVINLNAIADAIKPIVLPGEPMRVRIVKPGEGATQGVGYLDDGTMVVVENARDKIGTEIDILVTNALQTAAGKMIFGRLDPNGHPPSSPSTTTASAAAQSPAGASAQTAASSLKSATPRNTPRDNHPTA